MKSRMTIEAMAAWQKLVASYASKAENGKASYQFTIEEILREKGLLPTKGKVY